MTGGALSGDMTIGYNGNGTVNLSGGTVSAVNLDLGLNSGSTGILNVSGTGSFSTSGQIN